MRTKIMATVGPASRDEDTLARLVDAGIRLFRLNFSHGGAADFAPVVERLRAVEARLGEDLTLMMDLSGPKLRTCEADEVEVAQGQEVLMGLPRHAGAAVLPFICLDMPGVLANLSLGDEVALSDGMLRFTVEGRPEEGLVLLKALNAGFAPPRKGVAFPDLDISIASLTAKDMEDLAGGVSLGLDAVAVSFVGGPDEISLVRSRMAELGVSLPVVAKVERRAAVGRLDALIEASDAIMVARGDLGVEYPPARLPALQKRIIAACNAVGKPVIVATQMLLSMVSGPMPTRAETTDVANAILDGADCLMLSEETAIGRDPVRVVRTMREIAHDAEEYLFSERTPKAHAADESVERVLAASACTLAERLDAAALVAHTMSGGTARLLAMRRPRQPIKALSPEPAVRRFLNFSWGVRPRPAPLKHEAHLERAEAFVDASPDVPEDAFCVILAGQPKRGRSSTRTNVVKLYRK